MRNNNNVAIVAIVALALAIVALGLAALQQPTVNIADHGSKVESTPSVTLEMTPTTERK